MTPNRKSSQGTSRKNTLQSETGSNRRRLLIEHNKALILNLTANVSLKDGQPFIHAHMTVADDQGRTYGGHVFQGCTVFVLEATVTELTGDGPVRAYDDETGLFMWPAE